jgi:hypothetical protein
VYVHVFSKNQFVTFVKLQKRAAFYSSILRTRFVSGNTQKQVVVYHH